MFFATPAMAQTTTGAAAASGGMAQTLQAIAFPVALIVLFYFLMIRPQQQRAKQHQAMVGAVKRGDTVVLNSGIIGKVSKVEDAEVQVEIAQGVNVKVVKSMISDVRTRGEPAPANDAKK
jgi:preprotein translocase subunit YajC